MAKPNNPKPKQRAVGGLAGLSKAQAEANKRIKAMTPAQRKAYQAQNKKNAIKVAATAASLIPAGRAAVVGGKIASKAIASKVAKKNLDKLAKRVTNKDERKVVTKMAKEWQNTPSSTGKANIFNRKQSFELGAYEYDWMSPAAAKALKPKGPKDLNKMKKALINNVNSKNLKGKLGTTRASQPSRPIDRNIAKHSSLRKKFPDKFKP